MDNRRISCPNCSGKVKSYGSREEAKGFRVIYYRCYNNDCLLRFTATLTAHEVVTPPVEVFGNFSLPKSTWTKQARQPASPPASPP